MTERSVHRRAANARSPRGVLADLDEAETLIRELRSRYVHAHDLAYSSGGGGAVATGGGRGDLAYVNPTLNAAASEAKEGSRHEVARAGKDIGIAIKHLRYAHSAATKALPGIGPRDERYVPVHHASDQDQIVTRAEHAESMAKQEERVRRGEL